MKRGSGIIAVIILVAVILAGCKDAKTYQMLSHIDTLIDNHPDSALQILDSLKAEKPHWARSQRMRHDLLAMKAQNKAYVSFTSDSIGKVLVDYYDSHGTPNDRILAHYLLGCVYRDLGEAPRAVDCYLDAVNQADTTAADCDYQIMGKVYSQMANIFHRQLLLEYEIESLQKFSQCAYLSRDTLSAINSLKLSASALILLNKIDSAESVLKQSLELYQKHGYTQSALQSSTMLMHLYVDNPEKLSDLKRMIDKYDAMSNLFDKHHELPPSKRQYYYYKGRYYEGNNLLDSAEYYYRKISHPNMDHVEKDPMYRGLLSVFKKRHLPDSIAKYAQLYCEVNDSSIAIKDRELTAQMTSLYNYNRNQKIAEQEKQKSRKARNLLTLIVVFFIGCSIIILWRRNVRQKELKQLAQNLFEARKERGEIATELEKLKMRDYESLIVQKEHKEKELSSIIEALQSQIGQADLEDHFQQLKESDIVKLFNEKKLYKKGVACPTKKEWKKLEQQFRKDMQATYAVLSKANLSQLELRICILFILGFDDREVNAISYSVPQTISKVKRRANRKLFNVDNAQSLKNNLITRFGL